MKKYLLAGILFIGFFFQTTAQTTQQLKEASNSPAMAEPVINDPVITTISPVESEMTGYTTTGQIHYRAKLKHNRLHGNWVSWYDNGVTCDSGRLTNGLPDGEWTVWYPNGQPRFVRNYKADNLERIQHEIVRYNPKTSRFALADLYHKNREAALIKMQGKYGFPKTSQSLPSHKLSLIAVTNTTGDNQYHPVFDKALLHGLFINYHEDGTIKDQGQYENGLRQGLWTEAVAGTGNYSKGWYEKGNRIRQWKTYNHKGQLLSMEEYRSGKPVWKKEYKN